MAITTPPQVHAVVLRPYSHPRSGIDHVLPIPEGSLVETLIRCKSWTELKVDTVSGARRLVLHWDLPEGLDPTEIVRFELGQLKIQRPGIEGVHIPRNDVTDAETDQELATMANGSRKDDKTYENAEKRLTEFDRINGGE